MAASNTPKPPKRADQFLRWFCKSEWVEPILGDLHEQFPEEFSQRGKQKAHLWYWYQVFHFLRPFALKSVYPTLSSMILFKHYVKFAWRNLGKHWQEHAMNLLSLSVGLACFIFIFLFLKEETSYDQHLPDYEQLHRIAIDFVDEKGSRIPDATTPPALTTALLAEVSEIESATRLFPSWGRRFLLGPDAEHKFYEKEVLRVDSSFLDVFGFELLAGDPETALDAPTNMIITESKAQKYFGTMDVIGKTVTFFDGEGKDFTISAVAKDVPANTHFTFDFLVPLTFSNLNTHWGWYNFYTYVKLHKGSNISTVEPQLAPLFRKHDPENLNIIYSQPVKDIHLHSKLKWELAVNGNIQTVYIFAALALFVLLISFINFINLTIAHSTKRTREVGLRKVFGAYRKSLISQFLIESSIILAISLVIGCFLAELLFQQMGGLLGRDISIRDPQNLPYLLGLIGLLLLPALLAVLYPATNFSKLNIAGMMKGVVNKSGVTVKGARRVLLVIQYAVSVCMIIGSIVVYQQLSHIQQTDIGFNKDQVMIIPNTTDVRNVQSLQQEILQIAEVEDIALSSGVLGGINWTTGVGVPESIVMNFISVSLGYLEMMDIELIEGRSFSADFPADSTSFHMVVNEQAMRELGMDYDMVGKEFPAYRDGDSTRMGKIVGIVEDFHFTSFREEIKPFAFFNTNDRLPYLSIQLKQADAQEAIQKIQAVWERNTLGIPFEYYFLDTALAEQYEQEKRLSKVLLALTFLALFIAFMGMFAMANLNIKDRLKEIAIRKVLGASVPDITWLISWRFILMVIIANLIAGPLAYLGVQNWLNEFAYRIDIEIWMFLLAAGLTLLLAWAVVGLQSIQAASRNPVDKLSYE